MFDVFQTVNFTTANFMSKCIAEVDVVMLDVVVNSNRPQKVCDWWDHFFRLIRIYADTFDLAEFGVTVY